MCLKLKFKNIFFQKWRGLKNRNKRFIKFNKFFKFKIIFGELHLLFKIRSIFFLNLKYSEIWCLKAHFHSEFFSDSEYDFEITHQIKVHFLFYRNYCRINWFMFHSFFYINKITERQRHFIYTLKRFLNKITVVTNIIIKKKDLWKIIIFFVLSPKMFLKKTYDGLFID